VSWRTGWAHVLFFGLVVLCFLQYLAVRRAWKLARWIGRSQRRVLRRT
jgi:hypothetical protein